MWFQTRCLRSLLRSAPAAPRLPHPPPRGDSARDSPGSTFVESVGCGRGAGASCRQCPAGTFSSAAGRSSCKLCRKCEGIFRYLKACSSQSDAECTCEDGYRCSGDGCTHCDRSCGIGQESTSNGCQTCQYGTFNDQPNGSCKNWTKCSANQVLEPGTAAKDVICKHASVNPTLVTTLPTTSLAIPFSITVPGKDLQTDIIRILLTVAGLLCIVFLLPCICFSVWQKKKLHAVFKKMHTTPEQSIQEDDTCSCRFPEEEQGLYTVGHDIP
ncbi:tumor necrosis factor receptor superfamily member 9 isoform X1 [Myiozetetes cayanensis]|uniref:tumor necrosis factor receptor superfamily member 9 isoform X1 n=1 Tax=Myiozetetes cayanensis TaxID=478635 RepID=UPI00215FF402|nr:tumor necrosis factor receptor superfamily member 9 isoform X1 [Myiozetetes cayanensis]